MVGWHVSFSLALAEFDQTPSCSQLAMISTERGESFRALLFQEGDLVTATNAC